MFEQCKRRTLWSAQQQVVQRDGFVPVGRGDGGSVCVDNGNCGLYGIWPKLRCRERLLNQGRAFSDLGCVLQRTVLVFERNQFALW